MDCGVLCVRQRRRAREECERGTRKAQGWREKERSKERDTERGQRKDGGVSLRVETSMWDGQGRGRGVNKWSEHASRAGALPSCSDDALSTTARQTTHTGGGGDKGMCQVLGVHFAS